MSATEPNPAALADRPGAQIRPAPAAARPKETEQMNKRLIKTFVKRLLLLMYKIGLRLEIVIIPNHYYSNVPDIYHLRRTEEIWANKSLLPGITFDLDEQIKNLEQICLKFHDEYKGNPAYNEAVEQNCGPGYGYIEAQALHGVLRYFRPRAIVEVGSGVSTYCMLKALERNAREGAGDFFVTCIEPRPSSYIKRASVNLIQKRAQEMDVSFFDDLEENDFLFIDSSHTVKTGSDVNYLILEVLPRLNRGVLVHFHDIYFPYDYGRDALNSFFCWSETSLLRAFLVNNDRFKIIFCLSQLHYDRKDALKQVFPEYKPQIDERGLRDARYPTFGEIAEHFPSSIYLKRT